MVLEYLGITAIVGQAIHPHNILLDWVHNQKEVAMGIALRQSLAQNGFSCAKNRSTTMHTIRAVVILAVSGLQNNLLY